MSDWRSEPPDEAGDWIWRRRPGSRPQSLRVIRTADGFAEHSEDNHVWPLPTTGQWIKVPE